MKFLPMLLCLSFAIIFSGCVTGCATGHFERTNPDGTKVNFDGSVTAVPNIFKAKNF